MTELFLKCVDVVFKNEGILSNDPDDKGGLTKYGIASKYHPEVDVANLTMDQAKEIYYNEYWSHGLDFLDNPEVALQIFDFSVNVGVYKSIRIAQHTARVHEDGLLGNGTIQAINNSPCFLERFKTARIKYYQSLNNPKFEKGWINRVVKTNLSTNESNLHNSSSGNQTKKQ